VTIALGGPAVPVGAYTQTVLEKLPAAERRRLLANVRDREPDVTGIVGKLSQGAIGAGFLYATDVRAAGGGLRAIDLPASLQPQVAYGAAVVRGGAHEAQAKAFVAGLLSGQGRAQLVRAGFLPPPR
jgi:molybdate transport system substrate-binding protein